MSRVLLILFALVYVTAVMWRGLEAKNDVDDAEWTMKAYCLPSPYFGQEAPARGEFIWETTVPSLYRWYAGGAVRGNDFLVILDGVESGAYANILPGGAFDKTSAYNTIARKNGKLIRLSVSPAGGQH